MAFCNFPILNELAGSRRSKGLHRFLSLKVQESDDTNHANDAKDTVLPHYSPSTILASLALPSFFSSLSSSFSLSTYHDTSRGTSRGTSRESSLKVDSKTCTSGLDTGSDERSRRSRSRRVTLLDIIQVEDLLLILQEYTSINKLLIVSSKMCLGRKKYSYWNLNGQKRYCTHYTHYTH